VGTLGDWDFFLAKDAKLIDYGGLRSHGKKKQKVRGRSQNKVRWGGNSGAKKRRRPNN